MTEWQVYATIVLSGLVGGVCVALLLRFMWRLAFGWPPRRIILMGDDQQLKRLLAAVQ